MKDKVVPTFEEFNYKKSKEDVEYVEQSTSDKEKCGNCIWFLAGVSKCEIVDGDVNKEGWCTEWKGKPVKSGKFDITLKLTPTDRGTYTGQYSVLNAEDHDVNYKEALDKEQTDDYIYFDIARTILAMLGIDNKTHYGEYITDQVSDRLIEEMSLDSIGETFSVSVDKNHVDVQVVEGRNDF